MTTALFPLDLSGLAQLPERRAGPAGLRRLMAHDDDAVLPVVRDSVRRGFLEPVDLDAASTR